MKRILIINGPNLNMTGIREKEIYGTMSLDEINEQIKKQADQLKCEVEFFQSNSEGEIIDKIHSAYGKKDGLIINPGAYSHYSLAIADAIKSVSIKTIEVHISNIFSRESERSNPVTAKAASGLICGFSYYSYILALEGLINELKTK